MYSPGPAFAAGFLHRVVPARDLLSSARAAAERLARESSRADKARLVAERAEFIERQLPADLELMKGLG
jgi:enoyl-CoA hydratase/carnithine racemase